MDINIWNERKTNWKSVLGVFGSEGVHGADYDISIFFTSRRKREKRMVLGGVRVFP